MQVSPLPEDIQIHHLHLATSQSRWFGELVQDFDAQVVLLRCQMKNWKDLVGTLGKGLWVSYLDILMLVGKEAPELFSLSWVDCEDISAEPCEF